MDPRGCALLVRRPVGASEGVAQLKELGMRTLMLMGDNQPGEARQSWVGIAGTRPP